jgi:hypothetical protein
MSRSFKKNPYATDPSNSKMKPIHSRKFRRIIRQRLKPWKYRYEKFGLGWCNFCNINLEEFNTNGCMCLQPSPEPVFPHPFEVTNPASVCDFRFYSSDPRDRRK